MAANQINIPYQFGWPFTSAGSLSFSSLALSAAADATWLAYSFTSQQAKTLTDVWVFAVTITGGNGSTVPAANDFTCEIQTDSANSPSGTNATGGGAVSMTAAGPVSGTWIRFTFTGVTIAAGTQYWIVLKNPNTTGGSPTTIFPTYQWFPSALAPAWSSPSVANAYNYTKKHTTNSGGAWGTTANSIGGWRIAYNDSTYDGIPINGPLGSASTGSKVFNNGTSSQEAGIKFTAPANANGNLFTVSLVVLSNSGVGPVKMRVYEGSSTSTCTLKAESETLAATEIGNSLPVPFHFSADVVLTGGTVYRITLADNSSTGTSAKYFTAQELTLDANTPTSLIPIDGTMVHTVTTAGATALNGNPVSAFTDTAVSAGGTLMMMGLGLDTNGEFASTGGSGAGPFSRIFTGM